MYLFGYPLLALCHIVDMLLTIYTFVIIGSVIISWVGADPYNQIVRIIGQLTRPALVRVRKYVPAMGGFDLSPLVIILAITFIQQGILPIFKATATNWIAN